MTEAQLVMIKQRATSEMVRRIAEGALHDGLLTGFRGGHVYFLHFEEVAAVERCLHHAAVTDKPVRVDCVATGETPLLSEWIDAQIRQTRATQTAIVISVQAVPQGPFAPLMCGVFDV